MSHSHISASHAMTCLRVDMNPEGDLEFEF